MARPLSSDVRRNKHKRSYADAVYDLLRRDILRGTIEPGERLPEDELSRRYRVSRTPIREALYRLEAEGLVTTSAGRGMIAAEFDEDEIIQGYDIRGALEGVAARLAAQRATQVDIAKLDVLLNALTAVAEAKNVDELVRLGGEFHFHIWRVAGNRRLLKIMRDLEDSVGRFQRLTLLTPGRIEHAMAEHRALADAIREHDGARAEQIARDHMHEAQHARVRMNALRDGRGEERD